MATKPTPRITNTDLMLVNFGWDAKFLLPIVDVTPLLKILSRALTVKDSDYVGGPLGQTYRISDKPAPSVNTVVNADLILDVPQEQYKAFLDALRADIKLKEGTTHAPITFDEWLAGTAGA